MKQITKYILILLIPFTIMIIVNELYRPFIKEKPWRYLGVDAMNSAIYDSNKCSWACHNSTSNHCIKNHVKIIKPRFPYYNQINDFYWGIINFNSKKTNGKKVSDPKFYAAMNLIFLVILWPLFMYFLLINYLRLRKKIRILENY
ncbi:MAG: hypothetical protein P8H59_07040 [Flavobacteriales bacterium]|nr:hypothetical protein [Flavobacteriales bacterium]